MKILPLAVLSVLLFGALGTLSAIWAVVWIGRRELLTAVVALGICAFCFGFIVPFAKVVPGRVSPRGAFDDFGTTFRPDRGVDIPIQISLVGLTASSAVFAIFAPLGNLDIPVPHTMRFYLPFMTAVVAVTGIPIVWRNLRRGSTKYLRLTPAGFEIVQGWRSQGGNWAQVEDVTDVAPGQPAATTGAIVVVMSDDSAPTMAAASFTPAGAALRRLVRFYWEHSDRRNELTDGRALKRLADERFEAGS